ncbi:MAG: FAD-dependent oxidoreductase [Desulfobacteraceae bacterium]|jgi:NADPH-dependent glutamate synthase beta subunit-like oxidoreductase/2,4-dienoyl-CoA reductase-like NADH-dependent reductase (Old Yellow Enzyme family)
MKYKRLFSPLIIRGCVLPNRIMSTAAVTRLAAEDGHVTPAIIERYQRMAKGGLGAMVVEAAVVLPSRSSYNLRLSSDEFVPELAQFTDAVRSANPEVKIGIQLIHFLKLARSGWRQRVEDLSEEDIRAIPEQFAEAALRARSAGFDFVEIHMAHFTTLASFLSLVNKRMDDFGGDFEGRVRLPTDVVLAVRSAVGDGYPVGMRMNGEEFTKEGNTLYQSTRVARRLAVMGVDYISVSAGERFEDAEPPLPDFPPFAGTGYSGYRMSPRWWNPDGVQVFLASGIRKALRESGIGIPVVTAGKIRTPRHAEKVLTDGDADIIGMARGLLCDPDWPIKAREDRAGDIVLCAACGFCSEADERYETVTCIQWPKGALNAPSPWYLAPPCSAACPAGVDIRGYIERIKQGRYEEALELIEEKIPLAGVVCRVCPRFCEEKCNRAEMDEAVAINALKRFAFDSVALHGRRKKSPVSRIKSKRVAVIGSGPAGLTAAAFLARRGYPVTVFEREEVPGGMLALGIPEYRLPREILRTEIDAIRELGVEIRLNHPVDSLEGLQEQGFSAIFVAVGAHKSATFDIPNTTAKGVVHGTPWLRDVNLGKEMVMGEKVAVIGGGNVAIDSARTALRMGAKDVSIVYRRSSEEMPAIKDEVEAALEEGVKIRYMASPCRIVCADDQCCGLECLETELGPVDESGRRKPVHVEGSEFTLDADMVIVAVGEVPDLDFLSGEWQALAGDGGVKTDPLTLETEFEGIFSGGDAVTGPASVIEAVAAGRKAALAIERYLEGMSQVREVAEYRTIPLEDMDTQMLKKRARVKMPVLLPKKRKDGFEEVETGFAEMDALKEADRCLQCGMFPKK